MSGWIRFKCWLLGHDMQREAEPFDRIKMSPALYAMPKPGKYVMFTDESYMAMYEYRCSRCGVRTDRECRYMKTNP